MKNPLLSKINIVNAIGALIAILSLLPASGLFDDVPRFPLWIALAINVLTIVLRTFFSGQPTTLATTGTLAQALDAPIDPQRRERERDGAGDGVL